MRDGGYNVDIPSAKWSLSPGDSVERGGIMSIEAIKELIKNGDISQASE